MQPKLVKRFQELEQARHKILSAAESYPPSQLFMKPAPGEWSIAQVIIHLSMTEMQILGYIQKRMSKGALQPATIRSWSRYMVVKLALRYRKKIKAPRQVISPPEEVAFAEAVKDWEQTRAKWQQALSQIPAQFMNKELFKHPLMGYITISQTLSFMTEHVLHHIAQIKRIGKAVGKKEP